MDVCNILSFMQLIEDEGCIVSHQIERDGRRFQYYLSWNQTRRVCINITFETQTIRTAKALLIELELDDIIDRLGI